MPKPPTKVDAGQLVTLVLVAGRRCKCSSDALVPSRYTREHEQGISFAQVAAQRGARLQDRMQARQDEMLGSDRGKPCGSEGEEKQRAVVVLCGKTEYTARAYGICTRKERRKKSGRASVKLPVVVDRLRINSVKPKVSCTQFDDGDNEGRKERS